VMLVWGLVCLCIRRRYQFGLRSLLLFLVTVSVPLGWLAWEMERAKRQREAVEAVGGCWWVIYDYELDEGRLCVYRDRLFIEEAPPTPPAWLRKPLGNDFFWNLKGLRGLEGVEPGNTPITTPRIVVRKISSSR